MDICTDQHRPKEFRNNVSQFKDSKIEYLGLTFNQL